MSMIAGGIASRPFFERYLRSLFEHDAPPADLHAQKFDALLDDLRRSSAEIDDVLHELSHVVYERSAAAVAMEEELVLLENREREMQERISDLEDVPLPALEHFAQSTRLSEKRSARRDYWLFAAGVFVSTFLSIVFFLLQPG